VEARAALAAIAVAALTLLLWQLPKHAYPALIGLLALLGACAGLYLLWRSDPAIAFALALVLSTFASQWDRLGPSLPVGLNRLVLATGAAAILLRAAAARDRPPLRLTGVHALLALALAGAACSAALAGTLTDSEALFTLVDRFGLIPFTAFALAPLAFPDERRRRWLAWTLVGLGAYLGFVALFEAAGVRSLVFPHYILDPSVGIHAGRARGPFVDAAANGFALFACVVGAAIAYAGTRSLPSRVAAAAVAALCAAGLLFTLQRQVWLAAVLAGVLVLGGARELRRLLLPAAGIVALMVVLALAAVPGLAGRAHERADAQRSLWDRRNSDAAALRMVAERPLTGFGWHRFASERMPYFWQAGSYPLTTGGTIVHNVYLSNAVELGLPLTALWLVAVALALGGAVLRRGPPELRPWRLGACALLIFWLVAALFSPVLHPFPNLALWLVAGVAAGISPPRPVR
jgi:O-antigen ligase